MKNTIITMVPISAEVVADIEDAAIIVADSLANEAETALRQARRAFGPETRVTIVDRHVFDLSDPEQRKEAMARPIVSHLHDPSSGLVVMSTWEPYGPDVPKADP